MEKTLSIDESLREVERIDAPYNEGKSPESSEAGIQESEDIRVTPKTWLAVLALSSSSGLVIWLMAVVGTISSSISVDLNARASAGQWYNSSFVLAAAITGMLSGANSDLFGRRYFILYGDFAIVLGTIVAGTAKNSNQFIAGMALVGTGSGCTQMASFCIPELLPQKWRHIGVVMSEGVAYFCTVVAPVAARLAISRGDSAWRWLFYPVAIATGLAFLLEFFIYYPPKHPHGIPFTQAIREVDYIGMVLFIISMTLIMVGIVDTSYLPSSSDPGVIAPLVSGFGVLIGFACWETWAPLKQPLTPTHLFTNNYGRTLTVPFMCGILSSIFYLGPQIIWGTMTVEVFTTPADPISLVMELNMVQGLGITIGGIALAVFGSRIKHWRGQMVVSMGIMTLTGGLFALARPGRLAGSIVICVFSGISYAWGTYLSFVYIQFGAPQIDLGIVGGLGCVARFSGGIIATTVFGAILNTGVKNQSAKLVVAAAEAAGATPKIAESVLHVIALGSDAVMAIPGVTVSILQAATAAYTESYVKALQTVAYVSVAFGAAGVIASCFLEDITPKMVSKIEVYLENDVNAEKNRFH